MALNDEWTYTLTKAGLEYTVYAVNPKTGEARARASFRTQVEAEGYAEIQARLNAAGPGWDIAVEREHDGFVTWTSF